MRARYHGHQEPISIRAASMTIRMPSFLQEWTAMLERSLLLLIHDVVKHTKQQLHLHTAPRSKLKLQMEPLPSIS